MISWLSDSFLNSFFKWRLGIAIFAKSIENQWNGSSGPNMWQRPSWACVNSIFYPVKS
jgi:hypothetical protein